MKSAGKARSNGLYRHIRTSKEIIRNLLNDSSKHNTVFLNFLLMSESAVETLFLIHLKGNFIFISPIIHSF